jgi:hypothetical protein
VNAQNADGSWSLDDQLGKVLGKQREELFAYSPDDLVPSLWATALALIWLEVFFADKRDVWELLFEKGNHYLETTKGSTALDCAMWKKTAREYIFKITGKTLQPHPNQKLSASTEEPDLDD